MAKVRGAIVSYLVRFALSLVMGVVISRALEPEGRGEYSIVVVVAGVAILLGHLSIGQASVSFWASHRGVIVPNALLLGPPLGIAAAAIVWSAVAGLGPGVVPIANPGLLAVALAMVPIAVTIVHLTMITLLMGRVDVVNRSLTIAAGVQCAVLLALSVAGLLTTTSVVWAWALGTVLPLAILLPTLRPHLGAPDFRLARRMIEAGAQYHLGVAALFLLLRTDVLLLNALTTAEAVGLYTLAVSIGEMTYAGTDALSHALIGRQAEAQIQEAAHLTIRTTRVALIVAGVTVAGLCVVAPLLVPLLYGEAFSPSVAALFALAPGILVYAATRGITPYLLRLGRPFLMSGLSLLALSANVTLGLTLIPRWGIVGCALATTGGYLVLAAGLVTWLRRSSGQPLAALVPGASDLAVILNGVRSAIPRRHSRRAAGD